MAYNFFDKNTSGGTVNNEITSNKEFSRRITQPIIRKFEKREVDALFIGNIWGADLADMRLISKFIRSILHM